MLHNRTSERKSEATNEAKNEVPISAISCCSCNHCQFPSFFLLLQQSKASWVLCHVLFRGFLRNRCLFCRVLSFSWSPTIVHRTPAICSSYCSYSLLLSWVGNYRNVSLCVAKVPARLWPNDTLTLGLPLPIQITSQKPLDITLYSHIYSSSKTYIVCPL